MSASISYGGLLKPTVETVPPVSTSPSCGWRKRFQPRKMRPWFFSRSNLASASRFSRVSRVVVLDEGLAALDAEACEQVPTARTRGDRARV